MDIDALLKRVESLERFRDKVVPVLEQIMNTGRLGGMVKATDLAFEDEATREERERKTKEERLALGFDKPAPQRMDPNRKPVEPGSPEEQAQRERENFGRDPMGQGAKASITDAQRQQQEQQDEQLDRANRDTAAGTFADRSGTGAALVPGAGGGGSGSTARALIDHGAPHTAAAQGAVATSLEAGAALQTAHDPAREARAQDQLERKDILDKGLQQPGGAANLREEANRAEGSERTQPGKAPGV